MLLKDAVIAITGAAGGLGLAMAYRFGTAGAQLALIDLAEEGLNNVRDQLAEKGIDAQIYRADICDEVVVETTFATIEADFGHLDVLVNNAGITRDALLIKLEDGRITQKMSLDQWRAVIDTNLTGTFLCGREAAGLMARAGRGGCIVNISSVAAQGNIGQSNYSAAKAGVVAMAMGWAKELAQHGIRTAAVAPGFTRTPILDTIKPEVLAKLAQQIPVGRTAEPNEIAQAVEFIITNDYFNGRVLEIDGGLRI